MVGATQPLPPNPTIPAINICVGGYDGSVANLSLTQDSDELISLAATFAYDSHIGAIRSASFNGPTLVTGGVDETIRIYDLAKRVERGSLLHHTGTVNALRWLRDGNRDVLLSASDDMTIGVWRVSDWRCLKKLTAHQAPVVDVAPHPSGRVALSIASNRGLFAWDLVKGKVVFSAKTKGRAASRVLWDPSGAQYMLVAGSIATLSSADGRTVSAFEHDREVLAATFLDHEKILTGGEDKVVKLFDQRAGGKPQVVVEHDGRVRGVECVEGLVFSADSRGGLKIWDVRMGGRPRLETSVGGGDMKLTCMAAALGETRAALAQVEEGIGTREDGEGSKVEEEVAKEPQSDKCKSGLKRAPEEKRAAENAAPVALQGTASQRKRRKRKAQHKS